MAQTADVVVIGGGIIGSSIGLFLAESGVGEVVLLEKRFLAAGSSGKSGAILRQHYSHPVTIGMARESLFFYASFQEQWGSDIGFHRPGMVLLASSDQREHLERNVTLQTSLGVETQILDRGGLLEIEPRGDFPPDSIGAWEPEAAYVQPVRTVYGVVKAAREKGVRIREGFRVVEFILQGDRVKGVKGADGEIIEAPVVVCAGGPWTRKLLAEIGTTLPLQAVRPEQAYLEPPADFGPGTAIYADLLSGAYWKPEHAGWTRIGKLSYDDDEAVDNPDRYDEGVSHSFIEFARSAISTRFPAYQRAISWGGCGALYTVTPDAHPLIGAVPGMAGLYLASGFSGHGFKMGPAVGKGVAGLITGSDKGSFDPAFFAIDRLQGRAGIKSGYRYSILG